MQIPSAHGSHLSRALQADCFRVGGRESKFLADLLYRYGMAVKHFRRYSQRAPWLKPKNQTYNRIVLLCQRR